LLLYDKNKEERKTILLCLLLPTSHASDLPFRVDNPICFIKKERHFQF